MAGVRAATIYAISVILSLLVLGLYILGASRYLTNLEENTCDMTYMFEYPQYVRIALSDEIEELYPRFGLYAYGEGFVTEKHRRMKFSGIPVLFVPGNAGSHEQVRSLASVSLRKSIKDRTSFHFDYFTVSLGKDYSALYGGVLEEETAYVSLCISKILSLYGGKVDRVVLIGHSMGGIVAKAALLRSSESRRNENESIDNISGAANILVTLATPHKPIFLPDRTIAQFYEKLTNSSLRLRQMGTGLVSIGGGRRDILVSSSQTIEPSANLNIISSGIPGVWKSTDHLSILWCKQLILTIVRGLFDCVDVNSRPPKITCNEDTKISSLTYHLTSRVSGKKTRLYQEKIKFERGAEWIEDTRRQYTWTSRKSNGNKTVFLMIRLGDFAMNYDTISIESINLEARDWLFACSAHDIEGNSRICEWGWNLTNRTSLSPDPIHRSRKSLDIPMEMLMQESWKVSHLVVRIPVEELRKTEKTTVKIHVDLYKRNDRTSHLDVPHPTNVAARFFNVFPLGRILSPNPYQIIESSRGSLKYHTVLAGIVDAIAIEIETRDNNETDLQSDIDNDEPPQVILELLETSFNKGAYTTSQIRTISTNNEKKGKIILKKRLVVMHPTSSENEISMLRISLEPEYSYRIIIRRAGLIERIACSVRDRWPIVYPLIIALCLIGIATRIDNSPRKTTITIIISIIGALSLDFLFETLVAIGLVHVVGVTACCLVVFFGSVAHNFTARFLARIVALPTLWFDWLLGGFDRLPILTTFILLSLTSATCGAIAILISVPLYFLKLTRMYEDYLEELFMASLRHFNPFGRGRSRREGRRASEKNLIVSTTCKDSTQQLINSPRASVTQFSISTKTSRESLLNHLLLFVTWSFAAIPAIPSALVWAKNFGYEKRLSTEDPTMLISWLILTSLGSLSLVEIPSRESNESNCQALKRALCGIVLRLAGWIIACTAGFDDSAYYQWIIPPIIALAISSLSLLSILGESRTNNENYNSTIDHQQS